MKTEMTPTGELYEKGSSLLNAAKEYWEEYQKTGNRDAVVWLQGSGGELVVFTRGEYRDDIKSMISDIN